MYSHSLCITLQCRACVKISHQHYVNNQNIMSVSRCYKIIIFFELLVDLLNVKGFLNAYVITHLG